MSTVAPHERVLVTTAAVLAAVGIASLVLTFVRSDSPNDRAAKVASPPSTAVPITIEQEPQAASTSTAKPTDVTGQCAVARYIVVAAVEEPRPPDGGDLCLPVSAVAGLTLTVVGAFVTEREACRFAVEATGREVRSVADLGLEIRCQGETG